MSWGWLVTATGCKAQCKDFGDRGVGPSKMELGQSPQPAQGPHSGRWGEGMRKREGKGSAGPARRASFLPARRASRDLRQEKAQLCPTGLLGSHCRAGLRGCQTSPTRIAIIWKGSEIPFLLNPGGDFSAFQRAVFHHEEVVMSLTFLIQL